MAQSLQKKLSQLPAVDMQHAPAKLPSKLPLSAYVDLLAQSMCSMHSHLEACTVTVHQSLVESLLEKGWSNTTSFLGISACLLQAVEWALCAMFRSAIIIPSNYKLIGTWLGEAQVGLYNLKQFFFWKCGLIPSMNLIGFSAEEPI